MGCLGSKEESVYKVRGSVDPGTGRRRDSVEGRVVPAKDGARSRPQSGAVAAVEEAHNPEVSSMSSPERRRAMTWQKARGSDQALNALRARGYTGQSVNVPGMLQPVYSVAGAVGNAQGSGRQRGVRLNDRGSTPSRGTDADAHRRRHSIAAALNDGCDDGEYIERPRRMSIAAPESPPVTVEDVNDDPRRAALKQHLAHERSRQQLSAELDLPAQHYEGGRHGLELAGRAGVKPASRLKSASRSRTASGQRSGDGKQSGDTGHKRGDSTGSARRRSPNRVFPEPLPPLMPSSQAKGDAHGPQPARSILEQAADRLEGQRRDGVARRTRGDMAG